MIQRLSIYFRNDNKRAIAWSKKITYWLQKKYPQITIGSSNAQALIVLGGDGTILEAVRHFPKKKHIIFGLNLGHVGFLASVREPKKFFASIDALLRGKYQIVKRMMIKADVLRNNKNVFSANSLNDISIQSLLGMVEIEACVDGHVVQYIRGTGALVSTATGSTAFNLSAHGPIVMPDIKCMILTEIMDHNIPTPSIVVKRNREITLKILGFRKRGLLKISATGEKTDVILATDGENIFPIHAGDIIKIRRAPGLIKFAELEPNYFFKSIQEKFAFK